MKVPAAPVSRIGLGCSRIGSFNNPQPLAQSRALVSHALDIGVTVIDTSNIYGQGDSEIQIGLAVQGRRDKAFIVTKTGRGFSPKMRMLRHFKPLLRPLLAARAPKTTEGAAAAPSGSAVTAQRPPPLRFHCPPEHHAPRLAAPPPRRPPAQLYGTPVPHPGAPVAPGTVTGQELSALSSTGSGAARRLGME